MEIDVIATDRHTQIRKYIRESVSHLFDVWHMANSTRKKLVNTDLLINFKFKVSTKFEIAE
jgi:hypothetical protein